MDQTIVLALLTATTGIAVFGASKKKIKQSIEFFSFGAILAWVLLFFHLFFLPDIIILPTPNPLTAEAVQYLLAMIIIVLEIFGFYYLKEE